MAEELNQTLDNGETEVQVTTIGDVVGTGADGAPVTQHFTEEALEKIAEKHKDDEILIDKDHESELGGSTEAKGWLSKLKFVKGKGLLGTIKWTDIGRKLIENRVFRWLSPSFILDKETMEPVEMTSVALTNRPAQAGRLDPIVNSAPVENDLTVAKNDLTNNKEEEEEEGEMMKDEIIALVNELIDAKLDALRATKDPEATENACPDEKVDNEAKKIAEEVVEEAQAAAEESETSSEESETSSEESETSSEEKVAEPEAQAADKAKEEEKEEVIKIESLNSQPKTEGFDIVKNSATAGQKRYPGEGYAVVTRIS